MISQHQTILKTYTVKGLQSTLFVSLNNAVILWQHHNQNAVIVLNDGRGDSYQTTNNIEETLRECGFNNALPTTYKEERI